MKCCYKGCMEGIVSTNVLYRNWRVDLITRFRNMWKKDMSLPTIEPKCVDGGDTKSKLEYLLLCLRLIVSAFGK